MTQTIPTATRRKTMRFSGPLLLVFGVILPAFVIILEVLTGFCADVFFDPIPTVWHVMLALSVPVANLLAFIGWGDSRHRKLTGVLNAFAIVVAGYFTVMYAVLTPLALIAVLFLGMGLLPLSPGFSLICTVVWRFRLGWPAGATRRVPVPGLVAGVVAGLICVAAVQVPRSMTLVLMQQVGVEAGEHPIATSLLRNLGNRQMMLAACYEQNGNEWDPVAWVLRPNALHPQEARALYYRATGDHYQSVPAPRLPGLFRRDQWGNEWQWDEAQGSEQVGPRLKGLSLKQSRLDGVADSAASLAYLQWTMVFRNDSFEQREARARIALPPGAVVSRATLWINGEEREAAFGGRDQTRRAYQEVAIAQRRDPLLVSTAGPDRVQMQCFPIAPNGGEMKIRLGITVPLDCVSMNESQLWLPTFAEQNFTVPGTLLHAVWITADSLLKTESHSLQTERDGSGYALRGELGNGELWPTDVRLTRDPAKRFCWTDEPAGKLSRTIVQELRSADDNAGKPLVIAVDLSRRMMDHLARVNELLQALPDGTRLAVVGASDGVLDASGGVRDLNPELRAGITNALRRAICKGGADSVPALERAWDLASAEGCDVLWLHGSQPFVFKQTEGLLQRMERRPGTRIFSAQLQPGPNGLLEELESHVIASRAVSAKSILARIADSAGTRIMRELGAGQSIPVDASKTSSHLTRLWANQQVLELAQTAKKKEAIELATAAQLVTPVSGAVVLETKAQYAANGLTPSDPASVPSVPEPTTVAIAGVAMLLLGRRPRRLAA